MLFFRSNRFRFFHNPLYRLLASAALAMLMYALSASSLTPCEWHTCVPDCICDVRFEDVCAMDYGNYGWKVPGDATEYVRHHMRPDSPIGAYEIKPAGMRPGTWVKGVGEGIGKVLAIKEEGIVGQVYFEVHPNRLKNNNIFVELYGEVELGLSDCSGGKLLSKSAFESKISGDNVFDFNDNLQQQSGTTESDATEENETDFVQPQDNYFSWRIFPFSSYNDVYKDNQFECHPRSTGAIMASTEFTISDPFGLDSEGAIWYPTLDPATKAYTKKGTFHYCVRVIVEKDESSSEPSSYIDTKFNIEGSRSSENFEEETRIYANQPIDSKRAYVKRQQISVSAFLCKIPDGSPEKKGLFKLPAYGIGDSFTICAGPSEAYADDYKVSGFDNLICENNGQSRRLVVDGEPDALTSVETSSSGYTDLKTGTIVWNSGILAVRTTVTTGLIQLNETSVVCSGEAVVETKNEPNRNRDRKMRRDLQSTALEREVQKGYTSPFKITIDLDTTIPISGGNSKSMRLSWLIIGGCSLILPSLAEAMVGLL